MFDIYLSSYFLHELWPKIAWINVCGILFSADSVVGFSKTALLQLLVFLIGLLPEGRKVGILSYRRQLVTIPLRQSEFQTESGNRKNIPTSQASKNPYTTMTVLYLCINDFAELIRSDIYLPLEESGPPAPGINGCINLRTL